MLGLSNQFYSNPMEYSHDVLQQMMAAEAQKSTQQSAMELKALRAFFSQGQLMYCVPCAGGVPPSIQPPPSFSIPNFQNYQNFPPCSWMPSVPPTTSIPPMPQMPSMYPSVPQATSLYNGFSSNPQPPIQSTIQINFRNQAQRPEVKLGSDECVLGPDTIEIVIDLRGFTPAEIYVDVNDNRIEVSANHSDFQGSRAFSRRYDLPANIIVELTKCCLNPEGLLHISAPWRKNVTNIQ